jgi:acyl-CoA thioesterase
VSAFDTATAITPTGPHSSTADVDPSWHVRRGANGGIVAAVMLRALMAEVDEAERVPRSLTVHYPGPFDEGPTQIDTAVVRAGRSLTNVRAEASRDGAPVALALGAFSLPRPSVELFDMVMPAVPGPDELEAFLRPEGGPSFAQHFEYRLAGGALPFSGAEHAEAAVWMAPRDRTRLDYPLLAALTDAFIPVLFATQTGPVASPTVDLTVHFRCGSLPTDTGPWLGVFRTRLAAEGFMEEDGEIWSRDGVLLAQSRQLALAMPA